MPFRSSFHNRRQQLISSTPSPSPSQQTDGWTWSGSSMSDSYLASASAFAHHMFAQSPPASMPASKEPPQPALPESTSDVSISSEYGDKIFSKFHQHSLSSSTASGSSESSPTTTYSTVDDSSATEPSPGSSPESPPPDTFSVDMIHQTIPGDGNGASAFDLQRAAPSRKGRNLKNLAVNTSRTPDRAGSVTSLPSSHRADSAPSILSPAFVKPPTPPKRRPSNLGLTILTPSNVTPLNITSSPKQVRLAIPPTPGFVRPGALRHFQSSPSLPISAGLESHPDIIRKPRQLSDLETINSATEHLPARAVQDDEQNFDLPLSREDKPEAYPDGPICVYDPYVDLYLEPTAEQARQYDVILNVASEVRNPLLTYDEPKPAEPGMRLDGGGGIQFAPKRDPTSLGVERDSEGSSSPTTPKATPSTSAFPAQERLPEKSDPEYVHVPWEHNSDIVPDLLRLVKLIDENVKQRKRILLHCQCGVSRSASLVVAYRLYKDPSMSVQEAYDAVKQRSKWIGPNMNLIMQLQEFRSSLARGGVLSGNRGLTPITPSSAASDWAGPFSSRTTNIGPHASALSASFGPSLSLKDEATRAVSPGPASAPLGLRWPHDAQSTRTRARAVSAVRTSSAYVDTAGHVLPVLSVIDPVQTNITSHAVQEPSLPKEDESVTPTESSVSSPRSSEFAMTALRPPEEVESADAFGVMSPTATDFPSSPFDRSLILAHLGMGSMHQQASASVSAGTPALRSKPALPSEESSGLGAQPSDRLRSKISAPDLQEQRQLQSLQTQIEAQLPKRGPAVEAPSSGTGVDDALMSPRATEFTQNPFAMSFSVVPPAAAVPEDATRAPDMDPRSPAHKGASPITRNIGDVL